MLSSLPPRIDILRDEGESYGRKLAEAGVRVTLTRWYFGTIHGSAMRMRWPDHAGRTRRDIDGFCPHLMAASTDQNS